MQVKPIIGHSNRVDTSRALRPLNEQSGAHRISPGNDLADILEGFSPDSSDFSGCSKEGDKVDKGKEKESERMLSLRQGVGQDHKMNKPPILTDDPSQILV